MSKIINMRNADEVRNLINTNMRNADEVRNLINTKMNVKNVLYNISKGPTALLWPNEKIDTRIGD